MSQFRWGPFLGLNARGLFPFVPNGKFIILRCPKIRANYILIKMCSIIGTPNNHHFQFGTNGKVVVLGVPILKHFRVHFKLLRTTKYDVCILTGRYIYFCFGGFIQAFVITTSHHLILSFAWKLR